MWTYHTGYHASLLVERPEGWRLGPPGREGAPYVEYAWGDRRWYMEARYGWVLATLFWPTESVVYVRGHSSPPSAEAHHALRRREVSADELHVLVGSVEREFRRTDAGERADPHPAAEGYAGQFYPGVRPYTLFYNS